MEYTTKENIYRINKDNKFITLEVFNLNKKSLFQKTFSINPDISVDNLIQDLVYSDEYNGGIKLDVFVVLQIISKITGKSNTDLAIQKCAERYLSLLKEKRHFSEFFDED